MADWKRTDHNIIARLAVSRKHCNYDPATHEFNSWSCAMHEQVMMVGSVVRLWSSIFHGRRYFSSVTTGVFLFSLIFYQCCYCKLNPKMKFVSILLACLAAVALAADDKHCEGEPAGVILPWRANNIYLRKQGHWNGASSIRWFHFHDITSLGIMLLLFAHLLKFILNRIVQFASRWSTTSATPFLRRMPRTSRR